MLHLQQDLTITTVTGSSNTYLVRMEEWDEDDTTESRKSTPFQSTNRSDTTNTPATDLFTGQSLSSTTPHDSIERGDQLNTAISHPPGTLTGAMLNPPAISTSVFGSIRDAHSDVLAEDFEGPTLQKLVRFEIEYDVHWDGWNLYIGSDGKGAWVCNWPFCRLFSPYKEKNAAIRHVREDHLQWCIVMTDTEIIEKGREVKEYRFERHGMLMRAFETSNGSIKGVIKALKKGEPADKVVTMYESNEVLEKDEQDNDDANNDEADNNEADDGEVD